MLSLELVRPFRTNQKGAKMDKRKETILKIMEQIDEWAEENGITVSMVEQLELAERIYNLDSEGGSDDYCVGVG